MEDTESKDTSRLLKRYRIFFRGLQRSTDWPKVHRTTFSQIQELGNIKFDNYCAIADIDSIRKPWKVQTKLRAKKVAETAEECWKERRNEQGWRMLLEHQIFARFHVEVACPNCRARLWRSEIEVGIKNGHKGRHSLEARQKNRKACQCPPDTRPHDFHELGINRLFSDRADEKIVLESALRLHRPTPKSEPDRVYGLRQTNTLEEFLETTCKHYASGENLGLIRDTVRSCPFQEDGEPLLFPFLVHEAKSEKGRDGFQSIGTQTAFSIRALLKLQEALKAATGEKTTWLDGPLVWFLAHKGDEFRVSSCFVNVHDGVSDYDVAELWSGRLMSVDGALQLLLIIDYIFDWARDIYRPAILRELNILTGADPSDSLSVFHDNDILSMNDGVLSWIRSASMERDFEAKDDSFAQMHKLDSSKGVIRYASHIESRFCGLHLTGDSAAILLEFSRNLIDPQMLARKITGAFRFQPVRMTSETLETLEKLWTGKVQERAGACSPKTKFLTRITLTVYFNAQWEQIRELSYLAASEDGLKVLEKSCKWPHGPPFAEEPQQVTEVSSDELEEVIGKFKLASVEQNLAAAVSRVALCLRREPLGTSAAKPFKERKTNLVLAQQIPSQTAPKAPLRFYHMNPISSFSREMVNFVYHALHYVQRGSTASNLEVMERFLRVSSHHEEQTLRSDNVPPFPLPDSCVVSKSRYILITGRCSTPEAAIYSTQANVCLSILDDSLQIHDRGVLSRYIKRAVWKNDIFDTHRKNWPVSFKQSTSWPSNDSYVWNLRGVKHCAFYGISIRAWLREMSLISNSEMKKLFRNQKLKSDAHKDYDHYCTAPDLESEEENAGLQSHGSSKTPIVID